MLPSRLHTIRKSLSASLIRGFAIYRTPAPSVSGILEVRQTLRISPRLAGLAEAFDKLPKDGDGITREELQEISPSTPTEIMDAVFELFDNYPKDNKISYNELCTRFGYL